MSMGESPFSRRTLLQVVTAGSAVLLGALIPVSSANAATTASHVNGAVDATSSSVSKWTDIQGIHAEYRAAIRNFPLSLPNGWSFPSASALRNSEPNVAWEVGSGNAEAYLYWQRAVATAAADADGRGDHAEADRLLNLLEIGYATPTRHRVIDDADNAFVTGAINPALSTSGAASGTTGGGDFSSLLAVVGGR